MSVCSVRGNRLTLYWLESTPQNEIYLNGMKWKQNEIWKYKIRKWNMNSENENMKEIKWNMNSENEKWIQKMKFSKHIPSRCHSQKYWVWQKLFCWCLEDKIWLNEKTDGQVYRRTVDRTIIIYGTEVECMVRH